MQNVIAINAAARQGIIAAQATSDEMLLESIADGGRSAMHILYSRHNVRIYRFILRIVRDATMAEDLASQARANHPEGCQPHSRTRERHGGGNDAGAGQTDRAGPARNPARL